MAHDLQVLMRCNVTPLQDMSPLPAPPGAVPPLPEWPELTPAAQLVGSSEDASPAGSPAASPVASLASSTAASLDDGGGITGKGGRVTVDDVFGPVQTLSRAEEPAAAAANAAAKRAAPKVNNCTIGAAACAHIVASMCVARV